MVQFKHLKALDDFLQTKSLLITQFLLLNSVRGHSYEQKHFKTLQKLHGILRVFSIFRFLLFWVTKILHIFL